MVNAFEAVIVVVAVIGIVLSFSHYLWPFRAADELGHVGASWFDREQDRPPELWPDASQNDPPIPRRPLRPHL